MLDIIVLTSILATLFLVFIVATWQQFNLMSKTSYKDLRLLRGAKNKPNDKRKAINKVIERTIADMESGGVYFSEADKERLKISRSQFKESQYTLPPSVTKKNSI